MSDEKWLTVADAAKALKVSPRTVRRRCENGELVAELETGESGTGGRAWRIDANDVRARADNKSDRATRRTDGQNSVRTVTARPDGQKESDRAAKQTDTNQAQRMTVRPDGQADGQTDNEADRYGRAAKNDDRAASRPSARPDGQADGQMAKRTDKAF